MQFGLYSKLLISNLFRYHIKFFIFLAVYSFGIYFYLTWQIEKKKQTELFITNTLNPRRLSLIKETTHSFLSFITLSSFTQHFHSNLSLLPILNHSIHLYSSLCPSIRSIKSLTKPTAPGAATLCLISMMNSTEQAFSIPSHIVP